MSGRRHKGEPPRHSQSEERAVVCSGCDGLDAIATLTTDPLTAVGLCQCGEVLYRARPEPERGTQTRRRES